MWPYVETARGTYDWGSEGAQTILNIKTGKPVFYSYEYQPQWAVTDTVGACAAGSEGGILLCPEPPNDLFRVATCQAPLLGITATDCQFKEYVTTLVNRYKHSGVQTDCTSSNPQCNGVIQMYEFTNEPPYAPGSVACTIGTSCFPMTSYVQLASDWYYTIKGIDPLAQVCSPAFIINSANPSYRNFMSLFLSSGGAAIPFDCWDFHINETTPEDQIADITTFTGYLSANGISNPVLYATEDGRWGTCSDAIAAADQQAYVGRIELIYWSQNVKAHYWYGYGICVPLSNQITSEGVTTDNTLTPLGIAYGNVENWMVGSTMTSPCALTGSFWTCGLTLANGHQALAVWYPAFQSAVTASYTPAPQYTSWHDLNGNTGAISGAIAIGEGPILLEAGGDSLQSFTITVNPQTVTVTAPGQSGTTTVTVTPVGGFNQTLSYSCSGLPSNATCSFTATSSTTETLTITTAAPFARLRHRPEQGGGLFYSMLVPVLFCVLSSGIRKQRFHNGLLLLILVAILACLMLWMAGCGGGSSPNASPSPPTNPGTPVGNFSVVVTATASGTNPLRNTVTVALTVQ